MRAEKVKKAIYSSCTRLPAYSYKWSSVENAYKNDETGRGLVNAFKALEYLDIFQITGPDIVCKCEDQPFSLSGPIADAIKIDWHADFGEFISGNGTKNTTLKVTFNESYGITETMMVQADYGRDTLTIYKDIYVGTPETEEIIYDDPVVDQLSSIEALFYGATDYKWRVDQGNCYLSANGNIADVMPFNNNLVRVIVTASNRCGSIEEWISFIPGRTYAQTSNDFKPTSVAIYNLSNELVYYSQNINNELDLNTMTLKSGIYIIEYKSSTEIRREKIYIR